MVSRRSIILLIACAALALGAVLWLTRDTPAIRAEPPAQSEQSQTATSPTATPELAQLEERTSRESAGAPQVVAPPSDTTATLIVHVAAKETGKPLRSAHVYLWPKVFEVGRQVLPVDTATGTMSEGLHPGDDGAVEFTHVPCGEELSVAVFGDRDVAGTKEQPLSAFTPGERRELRVELPTQNDLTTFGRVVARADHAPVARARVRANRPEGGAVLAYAESSDHATASNRTSSVRDETFTDSDGLFEVSVAEWSLPYLRIDADGFALALAVPSLGHDARETAQLIELDPPATLKAHVVEAGSTPMSNLHVTLTASGHSFDHRDRAEASSYVSIPDQKWAADTEPDGSCTIDKLSPEVWLNVQIKKGEAVIYRSPDSLRLKPGETREIEWRLGGGCTLNGSAIDQDGQPAPAEREIWLAKTPLGGGYFPAYARDSVVARVKTNADGRFEFKDVAAGTWWIGPAAQYRTYEHVEAALAPLAQRIEVRSAPTQDVELHVYRDLYIRGTVVDPKGTPVPNGGVAGGPDPLRYGVNATCQKDGTFALGPIGPGTFALEGSSPSFAPSDIVKAEAGARDVVLLLHAGSALRGRLVDSRTGVSTAGELLLTSETQGGRFAGGLSTTTKVDGSFEIEGLDAGQYGIVARAPDGRFGMRDGINAVGGQTVDGLVIAVSPGGTLRIKYEGAKRSVPLKITSHGLPISWTENVPATKPLEKPAPQGALVIQVLGRDQVVARSIDVDLAAGEVKEVVIHDE